MNFLNDLITGSLIALFSAEGVALAIAGAILAAAVGILCWVGQMRVRPVLAAIRARSWELSGGGTKRGESVEDPPDLPEIMARGGKGSEALRRGWSRYSRTVQEQGGRRWSTARVAPFFEDAADQVSVLGWWANLFIAAGLVFTFLGVVAALSKATGVIGGGDAEGTQRALAELLAITATKFWTSIAGVTASIFLRVFERRWRYQLLRGVGELARHLEAWAEPLSASDLLARQLAALERQAAAMEGLRRDLAPSGASRRLPAAE